MTSRKWINCPDCEKEHTIYFDFFDPYDGDEKTEYIDCECGCRFMVTATIEFDISCGEAVKINYEDPNQLKLL